MAHEIYPPLLVDRGLADALRGAAADAAARVDVTVRERFAPEIEATIYFLCVELLHPGATIRVWADDEALHFDAKSDCNATTTVADRVSSLGGAMTVAPGHITGKIPVEP
jgi:hypothetical protein